MEDNRRLLAVLADLLKRYDSVAIDLSNQDIEWVIESNIHAANEELRQLIRAIQGGWK